MSDPEQRPFDVRKHVLAGLNQLKTSLPRLGDGDWAHLQYVLHERGWNWRDLADSPEDLGRLFDTLCRVVEQARAVATFDRAIGNEMEAVIRSNVAFRLIWQAVKDSGLFPREDDRFAGVELFLLAGAFPYEDDAGEG